MQAFFYLLQRDTAFENEFIGLLTKKKILISFLMPFLLHITCHVSHDIITPKLLEQGTCIFKETVLFAYSFYESKFLYVCLFVRWSICPFSLRFTVFLPPIPEANVQTF